MPDDDLASKALRKMKLSLPNGNTPGSGASRAAAKSGVNMSKRCLGVLLLVCAVLGLAGCPKGNQEFKNGKKTEAIEDYDSALAHYERALKADPQNAEYRLKYIRLRFEAGQHHVELGQKLLEKDDLQMALAEFQKAMMIDPSSSIARQETQNTLKAIAAKKATAKSLPAAPSQEEPKLMSGPPQLKPLSHAPINLKMTNDSKVIFETVAKLAGLSVIFDPDFTSRRIMVDLTNVTLEQTLDIVSLQAKAFWKPITNNTLLIAPDQPQKRKDYEEEIVRTIYVKNTLLPQELTEIVSGVRQLLDLRRVQPFAAQNAIIIRDTPDKVMLAEKIIDNIDKAKSEVVIQFAVLQTRRDRLRDLGVNPSTSTSLSFTGLHDGGSSSSSSAGTGGVPLDQLHRVSSSDYSITLPNAAATALLTDSQTRILEDPEIRVVDGQSAKLRIGDRVPIATGSFQAGIGGGGVSPLVNTQFQYLDVGVIVDVTPRIHTDDREVSLKLSVEISSVTGSLSIGGISQPVISTRKIEHDVRLEDGEVNILGGLIEHTNTRSTSGWPGVSQIPFLRNFLSDNNVNNAEQEVLIVVIPHIVRTPNITAENLRSFATGTDTNPEVRLESVVMSPPVPAASEAAAPPASPAPAVPTAADLALALQTEAKRARFRSATPAPTAPADPAPPASPAPAAPTTAAPTTAAPTTAAPAPLTDSARLRFEPATVSLKPDETTIIGLVVEGAQDLYSIPVVLQYDPKVLSVEDVRQGGFLSGGTQPITIVQRLQKERGQAVVSATRLPNTPGVSGNGTIFGVVVRGVAPGTSTLSILQVNANDSQQRPLQLATGEATVKVQP